MGLLRKLCCGYAIFLSSILFVYLSAYANNFTPFFELHYQSKKAYGFCMISSTNKKDMGARWSCFEHACFSLPVMLDRAAKEQVPFLMILPKDYNHHATTAEDAPFIEGARVALAWTSAYFRFKELGSVDVRVILSNGRLECDEDTVQNVFRQAFLFDLSDDGFLSQEENMRKRIHRYSANIGTQMGGSVVARPYYVPHLKWKPKAVIVPRFTENKTSPCVVVTGAAGFIGCYLVRQLLDRGYRVIGLDNLSCSTGANLSTLKQEKNFNFYQIDVSHSFDIKGHIDIVVHLASVPSPVNYYSMPIETLRSGLHGTRETIELARRKGARYFFASSSEVYGNPEINPQPESYPGLVSPIGKRSQYDESKRGAETLLKLYFDRYQLDIRIGRIFNTFGPGMQLDDGRVITNFIQAALDNKPMKVYGDGNQTRSPAFVSDTVNGLLKMIESETMSSFSSIVQRICNIGNPEEYSINEIAAIVNGIAKKYLQREVAIQHIDQIDATDPKVRQPDLSYIKKILNFTPQTSFKEGIEKTFLHYYRQSQT